MSTSLRTPSPSQRHGAPGARERQAEPHPSTVVVGGSTYALLDRDWLGQLHFAEPHEVVVAEDPYAAHTFFYQGTFKTNTLDAIQKDLVELKQMVAQLLASAKHHTVWITSFAPEAFVLRKNMPVCIEQTEDSFVATFLDANVSTSGETKEEACSNLRSLILDTLESLEAEPEAELGPEPIRQLSVLREFIARSN
jgi:predicted RNase H-like HicB family nuclease